jgi:hypothetical protein
LSTLSLIAIFLFKNYNILNYFYEVQKMDNQLQDKEIKDYVNALVDKSIEAFYLAIEIINKPTINYRSEGFCFFICNAWELALKAFLIPASKPFILLAKMVQSVLLVSLIAGEKFLLLPTTLLMLISL